MNRPIYNPQHKRGSNKRKEKKKNITINLILTLLNYYVGQDQNILTLNY